jgi:hypothetical protein
MGGYPSVDSLPRGVSDSKRIISQIDASDRAFLRAGMSYDGTHCDEVVGFHPLMHALRKSTKVKSDQQAWIKAVKQDLWDAVCTTMFDVSLFKYQLFLLGYSPGSLDGGCHCDSAL